MISKELLLKIARLAHLMVEEREAVELQGNLSSIFDYIGKLEKVDVSNVQPMSHVHGTTNVFREDLVEPSLTVEEGLRNAPDLSGRFIRVPIIIEPGTEH